MAECAFCDDTATRTCDDCGESMCDACSWDDLVISDTNISPEDCCGEQYEDKSEERESEEAEERADAKETVEEALDGIATELETLIDEWAEEYGI